MTLILPAGFVLVVRPAGPPLARRPSLCLVLLYMTEKSYRVAVCPPSEELSAARLYSVCLRVVLRPVGSGYMCLGVRVLVYRVHLEVPRARSLDLFVASIAPIRSRYSGSPARACGRRLKAPPPSVSRPTLVAVVASSSASAPTAERAVVLLVLGSVELPAVLVVALPWASLRESAVPVVRFLVAFGARRGAVDGPMVGGSTVKASPRGLWAVDRPVRVVVPVAQGRLFGAVTHGVGSLVHRAWRVAGVVQRVRARGCFVLALLLVVLVSLTVLRRRGFCGVLVGPGRRPAGR
jgi:hypothetical protein